MDWELYRMTVVAVVVKVKHWLELLLYLMMQRRER
jgi:hypothetical protein